jgi:hypothetical protein
MNESSESQPFGRNTCHICGGTDFTWGYVNELSQTGLFYIESAEPPQIPHFIREPEFAVKPIRARCCVMCNNVQFFVFDGDKPKDE